MCNTTGLLHIALVWLFFSFLLPFDVLQYSFKSQYNQKQLTQFNTLQANCTTQAITEHTAARTTSITHTFSVIHRSKRNKFHLILKHFHILMPTHVPRHSRFCWPLFVSLMAFILVSAQFIAHLSRLFLLLFLSHFPEELLYILPFMTWWVLQHPEFMGQKR